MAKKGQASMVDVFAPRASLVAKVASILAHVEEGSTSGAHIFDWIAIRSLLADREVQEWLEGCRAHQLVPVKRTDKPRGKG